MEPDSGVSFSNKLFSLSSFLSLLPSDKRSITGLLTIGELASLPGRLVRHPEDAGRLLHDPHEEVVDVVLQLPDVRVPPPQELLVLHQLLEDLLVGQTPIACRGVEGVAVRDFPEVFVVCRIHMKT